MAITVSRPVNAALMTAVSAVVNRNTKTLRMEITVRAENPFDRLFEQFRNRKRQRQAGIVFAGFDGVDRLPRDLQSGSQIRLGPRSLCPEDPQPIVHRYFRRTTACPSDQLRKRSSQMNGHRSPTGVLGTAPLSARTPYPMTDNAVTANWMSRASN